MCGTKRPVPCGGCARSTRARRTWTPSPQRSPRSSWHGRRTLPTPAACGLPGEPPTYRATRPHRHLRESPAPRRKPVMSPRGPPHQQIHLAAEAVSEGEYQRLDGEKPTAAGDQYDGEDEGGKSRPEPRPADIDVHGPHHGRARRCGNPGNHCSPTNAAPDREARMTGLVVCVVALAAAGRVGLLD